MKLFIVPLVCFSFSSFIVLSQSKDSIKTKKYKISNAYVFIGTQYQAKAAGTFTEFHQLIPQSKILNTNFDSYSPYNGLTRSYFIFSQSIGINKLNSEKNNYHSNPEFRIGFVYFTKSTIENYYVKKEIGGSDSSSFNGNMYYYDSIIYKNCLLDLKSEQLRFDASIIFRTNPQSQYSFFGGIGFNIGSSINSYAYVLYHQYTDIKISSTAFTYPNYQQRYNNIDMEDKIKLKNALGASIYLPFGFDCRLGNTRTHIIGELRPYLNVNSIPELNRTVTAAGMKTSIGLRVCF